MYEIQTEYWQKTTAALAPFFALNRGSEKIVFELFCKIEAREATAVKEEKRPTSTTMIL
jgi:hypothetical protein